MITCQDVQQRLSDFTDGGLSAAERGDIEAHLEACAACRGVLTDLRQLRRAAAALGPIAPPDHLWLQVAGLTRIARPPAPRFDAHVVKRAAGGQWMALAAALVVITIGAHFFLRTIPDGGDAGAIAGNAGDTPSVKRIADELALAMQHYDNAIVELEALAKTGSEVLDVQMAETLRQNIQIVNAAIDESRVALTQNPESSTARVSLFEALRRKVVVLQATVNLMNEMRKGNQTGAVEAAAIFTKQS